MATPVYSRVLAARVLEVSGDHELVTVPADRVQVIRTVVLGNASPNEATFILYVIHGSAGVWLFRGAVTANTTHQLEMRATLEPGDQVFLQNPTGTATVYLAGYDFELSVVRQ